MGSNVATMCSWDAIKFKATWFLTSSMGEAQHMYVFIYKQPRTFFRYDHDWTEEKRKLFGRISIETKSWKCLVLKTIGRRN